MKDSKEVLENKVLAKRIKDILDLHKQENEVLVLVQTNKEPEIYLQKFDTIIAKNTASGGGNLIHITRDMVEKLPVDFVKTENVLAETEEFKLPKVVEATEKVGNDFNLPKVGEATNEVRTQVGEIIMDGKEHTLEVLSNVIKYEVSVDKGTKKV